MSFHHHVTVLPAGDAEPPHFVLSADTTAVMVLDAEGRFRVNVSNHDDPAAYFRTLGERAERFALEIEVEQARQARLADGAA